MNHRTVPVLAMRFAVLCALSVGIVGGAGACHAQDKDKAADADAKTCASGLKYVVIKPGTEGKHAKLGDHVKVNYTGWLTDGTMFDSSEKHGGPADFVVGQLVPGWNEALTMMNVGAKWKLTIPPNLGYGERGMPPTIPGNATLVFELELIDLQCAPELPKFCAPDPKAQKTTASGLKYEVVKEGAGDPPAAEDAFELRFALWNTKGDLLQCSEQSGPIKARRDDLSIAFVKEGVSLLKPGARMRFEVPPELCWGAKSPTPQLPANSITVWELELVRVVKTLPVPPFEMPADAKLTTTASGLKYEVVEAGDGALVKVGDHVKVHYAGWLPDGTLFDSSFSRGEELDIQVGGGVIPGWTEGLQLMKPGSVYRFVIPPQLAYGPRSPGGKIGPNATLVFLIKLVKCGD